jgi:hypothetical protein
VPIDTVVQGADLLLVAPPPTPWLHCEDKALDVREMEKVDLVFSFTERYNFGTILQRGIIIH